MTEHTATVALYASFREAAGAEDLEVDVEPEEPVIDVVRRAADRRGDLEDVLMDGGSLNDHVTVAVDGETVEGDAPVGDCEEIALFPPMSGG